MILLVNLVEKPGKICKSLVTVDGWTRDTDIDVVGKSYKIKIYI